MTRSPVSRFIERNDGIGQLPASQGLLSEQNKDRPAGTNLRL
jgi:hypothetical protein